MAGKDKTVAVSVEVNSFDNENVPAGGGLFAGAPPPPQAVSNKDIKVSMTGRLR